MLRWFISRELKELALASSLWGASNASIKEFYGIKESTMRQLRQTYCQAGDVVQAPVFSGQPCLMDGLNANVSVTKRSRDAYYTVMTNVSKL